MRGRPRTAWNKRSNGSGGPQILSPPVLRRVEDAAVPAPPSCAGETVHGAAAAAEDTVLCYRCRLCGYESARRYQVLSHFQTRRHMANVERCAQQFVACGGACDPMKITPHWCPHCQLTFRSASGAYKHSRKCAHAGDLDYKIMSGRMTDTTERATRMAVEECMRTHYSDEQCLIGGLRPPKTPEIGGARPPKTPEIGGARPPKTPGAAAAAHVTDIVPAPPSAQRETSLGGTSLGGMRDAPSLSRSSGGEMLTADVVCELIRDNKEMRQMLMEQNQAILDWMRSSQQPPPPAGGGGGATAAPATMLASAPGGVVVGAAGTVNIQQNHVTATTTNHTRNTTTHQHNMVNFQLFLNEHCPNAMNLRDFVDSIELKLDDLELVGSSGYVRGISGVIQKNLQCLPVRERPLHCTDRKRRTIYLRESDTWQREDAEQSHLRRAIQQVSSKNRHMIPVYRSTYRGCERGDSVYSRDYDRIVYESLGGAGSDDRAKEDQIIRNLVGELRPPTAETL